MESLLNLFTWFFEGLPKKLDSNLGDLRQYGFEVPFALIVLITYFFWLFAHPHAADLIGAILVAVLPFVLPLLLWELEVDARKTYYWLKAYAAKEYVVLEIKLPEDITQSPYAMELVLRAIYQTGGATTPYHAYLGEVNVQFSLEIASDEGRIHFYVWTRKGFQALFENQLYAHYPTIQVVEVPDYTLKMPLDPAAVTVAGVEFAMQKPDPWPIVTYVEIGLDKADTKEEFKSDPFTAILEFLGSMKEGEHAWLQFMIRAHDSGMPCSGAPEDPKTGHPMGIEAWATQQVEEINEKAKNKDTNEFSALMRLTEGDKQAIKAIQGKLNKQLFEVGIRTLYIADKTKAKASPVVGFASIFRSFEHGSSGRGLNGLKPVFWLGPFNFPWHDFMNIRRHMLWQRYYDAYITRQFFYPPHKHPHIVLNTEEIATLYHFPGKVASTPTLQRMPSKRAEAPSNLPI